MKPLRHVICMGAVLALFLSGMALPAWAQKPSTVLLLPFSINAEANLNFLQKGISDMLSARLSTDGRVKLIDLRRAKALMASRTAPLDPDSAVALAVQAGADYVLYGTLTVFGNGISTDARLVETRSKKTVVSFNEFGANKGDVIYHINAFADTVNQKAFGRKSKSVLPQPGESIKTASRRNPEEMWAQESSIALERGEFNESGGPRARLWKTRRLPLSIQSLSIGDVDGDGNNETIFVDRKKIHIYRHLQGQFSKIAEIPAEPLLRFITIDVADINANGRAEIFATAITEDYRPHSMVLEWNGSNYIAIEKGSRWFYRILTAPGQPPKLMAQKGGFDNIFSGGVYELVWDNGHYVPAGRQRLPKKTNVFGFAYGDLLHNKTRAIIAFKNDDHLHLVTDKGVEEWTSSEPYGGSYTFLSSPASVKERKQNPANDPMPRYRLYLPQRIHIVDTDNDNQDEVIVVKNSDSTGRVLTRVRVFRGGHFENLGWDNVGLHPIWRTRKFSGYISDSTWADIDNDGDDELVFAVVKGNTLGVKSKSNLVVWDPALPQKK